MHPRLFYLVLVHPRLFYLVLVHPRPFYLVLEHPRPFYSSVLLGFSAPSPVFGSNKSREVSGVLGFCAHPWYA